MQPRRSATPLYRFGPFEFDPRAGELLKHGIRIRIQEQPLQVLTILLEHPGEAVLREEIQHRLWPNDTVVEFDHGINAALKRLRTALGDTADAPRYIETLARRGYRFVGELEEVPQAAPIEEQPEIGTQGDSGSSLPLDLGALTGKTIGHYRVLEMLGSGGMGVVYRAEDLTLGRQIAIKFLKCPASEAPPEILERFRSEARTAAALNHRHICSIYAVEESGGNPFIAMELVEGTTLAARLVKGPLTFAETLAYGAQMAQALDAGHRLGIVHRDFKPANVMLTRSGVKVLDFGLAKMLPGPGAISSEEDETRLVTQAGVIVGSPQYMAPEQCEGCQVDARCDIFAFGAVLYEMASGKKAFAGDSHASLMAAIREHQPPSVSSAGRQVLVIFDRLVSACLAKDSAARTQSLHDVAHQLEWMADSGTAAIPRPRRRRAMVWGTIAVAALAIGGLTFGLRSWRARSAASVPGGLRFEVSAPEGASFSPPPLPRRSPLPRAAIAVSPDGKMLAAVILDRQNTRRLWIRSLVSEAETILADTEGASLPFWSPDSKNLGFFARRELKVVAAAGGPARTISDAPGPGGGTWNAEGTIVFAPGPRIPLAQVPSEGGRIREVTRFGYGEIRSQFAPQFLPDGRRFLFIALNSDNKTTGAYLGSLDSNDGVQLLGNVTAVGLMAPDHLLFVRSGVLLAQRFDLNRGRPLGEAVRLAGSEDEPALRVSTFSVSQNGLLVYHLGDPAPRYQVVWRDRKGFASGVAAEPGKYLQIFLSPDENFAAVNLEREGSMNVWLLNLATKALSPLSSDVYAVDGNWSPKSDRLIYQLYRADKTTLMMFTLGEHSPKRFFEDGKSYYPGDWSPDGKWILASRQGTAVVIFPADGSAKPTTILDTPEVKDQFKFSPDGQWVAYNSMKSGQGEVYVSRFPSMTGTQQISVSGGCQPLWRKDGNELFYLTPEGKMMSVAITRQPELRVGSPKHLFTSNIAVACNIAQYAVEGQGQRLLMIELDEEYERAIAKGPLHVIVDWKAALQR